MLLCSTIFKVVFLTVFGGALLLFAVFRVAFNRRETPLERNLRIMQSPFSFLSTQIRAAKNILLLAEETYQLSERLEQRSKEHEKRVAAFSSRRLRKDQTRFSLRVNHFDVDGDPILGSPVGKAVLLALQFLIRYTGKAEFSELLYLLFDHPDKYRARLESYKSAKV